MPKYYRPKKDFTIIPAETAAKHIAAADRQDQKALIAIIWATGARLSEVLSLERKDVFIDMDKDDIEFTLITLKRHDNAQRRIVMSVKNTAFMADIVVPYITSIPLGKIFSFGKRAADIFLKRINEKTNLWITFHEYRHSRLSFLGRELRASEPELLDWFGWKTNTMIPTYTIRQTSRRFKDSIK